jgi:hypothetical protein
MVCDTGAENVHHTTNEGEFLGTPVGESQELFCSTELLRCASYLRQRACLLLVWRDGEQLRNPPH